MWRAEISVDVNLNCVYLLWVCLRDKTNAVLLIVAETNALDTVLGCFHPHKLGDDFTSFCANDEQVFSGTLRVVLLTANNIVVTWRIFESYQVELDQKETLLLVLHVNEVKTHLTHDCSGD